FLFLFVGRPGGAFGTAGRAFRARATSPALAGSLVKHDGPGSRDVERTDSTRHWNAQQVIAGAAGKGVEAGARPPPHQHAISGEIEPVVIGRAAFVEADNPQVIAFKLF